MVDGAVAPAARHQTRRCAPLSAPLFDGSVHRYTIGGILGARTALHARTGDARGDVWSVRCDSGWQSGCGKAISGARWALAVIRIRLAMECIDD